jgi:hypothetical protein
MRCKSAFVFIFFLFLISFSSASFNFSENGSSINNQYGISDYLKAKINISFYNESVNTTFRDSLGNSITLGNLLNKTSGYDYSFYDINNNTINSAFHVLEFNKANFSMPGTLGNFTYQLNFSNFTLFNEKIEIISTSSSMDEIIDEKYAELNKVKIEIKKYDLSIQKILNEFLKITSVESELAKIEAQYKKADTIEEYNQVLENLSYIRVPEKISENVNTNSITFYPNRATINLEVLKSIEDGSYEENEEGYLDAVYTWNQDNLDTKITFKEMLINYDSGEQDNLRIFQFIFDKREMKNEAYFIVKDMSNLSFYGNYSQTQELGYTYINLYDISDEIIFSTTENVNFLSVPVFISPTLSHLTPTTVGPYEEPDSKLSKWILFGLVIFLLVLIAAIAYIILQMWYKRKYENYLFKNRNNLYNIMTYIQMAKKKGMEREEIMKNLKKAGWTKEQTNYALRKYEGKKIIGIIEKPLKRVIEEIEKKPK